MGYRRTALAALLTLMAIAVPSAAWFYAGQSDLNRELTLSKKNIFHKEKGGVHAERLATRLDFLLRSESKRPFYHYQNLYHDPEGASEGVSVLVSPLAQGPPDPLIATHFQVTDDSLTLPTINDEFPEIGAQSTDSAHCALLEEMRDIVYFCLDELDGLAGQETDTGADDAKTVTLSAQAWHQNREANSLFAFIRYGHGKGEFANRWRLTDAPDEKVLIKVWPFQWHTLRVGKELGLVALRRVETATEAWKQGFIVSQETIRGDLEHSSFFPATFRPPTLDGEAPKGLRVHPVKGTSWVVTFDISSAMLEIYDKAERDRKRFYVFFFVSAIAAALAGLLVVAMVYHSERLALQRAQFAASAAHELRTPLAGLRLYGEMLADGLGNPAKARDYARRMAAEAERLGRVVTNVLSFTRLERTSLSMHPELGDLAEAVRAALRRQQPALREAGADLEINLPDDLPPVLFDRDAVSHIVQNLVDNAEKYTRGKPDRKIEIGIQPNSSGVELTVADNGEGIPREMQNRLFRAFARGHDHDDAEGLGLGLVLVKALANAQGGDIRYNDCPAGGARFTVTFAS